MADARARLRIRRIAQIPGPTLAVPIPLLVASGRVGVPAHRGWSRIRHWFILPRGSGHASFRRRQGRRVPLSAQSELSTVPPSLPTDPPVWPNYESLSSRQGPSIPCSKRLLEPLEGDVSPGTSRPALLGAQHLPAITYPVTRDATTRCMRAKIRLSHDCGRPRTLVDHEHTGGTKFQHRGRGKDSSILR